MKHLSLSTIAHHEANQSMKTGNAFGQLASLKATDECLFIRVVVIVVVVVVVIVMSVPPKLIKPGWKHRCSMRGNLRCSHLG